MSTIVTAADVVVRYNEQVVLNGATLAVEENDRVGLVGRNGCGKTTFLRVLAGLQTPDSRRGDEASRSGRQLSLAGFHARSRQVRLGERPRGRAARARLHRRVRIVARRLAAPRRTRGTHRRARWLVRRSPHRDRHVASELSGRRRAPSTLFPAGRSAASPWLARLSRSRTF